MNINNINIFHNVASLISKLIALGRSEDVERAANDEDYRKTLFKEFNL